MTFCRIFSILSLMLIAQFSWSQTNTVNTKKNSSIHVMEAKARLEELITQRYRDTISTSLDKSAFDVSVQIVLIESTNKKNEQTTTVSMDKGSRPLDLTVGLVDADSIIKKYQEDVQALKEREAILIRKASQEQKPELFVKSVNVLVGIQPSIGSEYADKLREWLKGKVTNDFGSIATSEVSFLEPIPSKHSAPKTGYDYLSDLQNLLGLGALALALILAVFLAKAVGSKDAQEMRKFQAQLQQNQQMKLNQENSPLLEDSKDQRDAQAPPERNLEFEFDMIRDLHAKIVWSSSENLQRLNDVMQGWLESGDRGLFKAACLMDVLISFGGRSEKQNRLPFEWSMTVPATFQKKMRDVFLKMTTLENPEKIKILDEVYWDLVTLKVLGERNLKQPFQYISAIPVSEMKTLLDQQNPRMRTLVVLHMPEDVRDDYMKTLPLPAKKEIFEQTIQMEKVLATDIETASEALKFEVKRGSKETDAQSVSLRSMAPKLLESMSVRDEISLLKEISRSLSDGGLSLKRNFPSLAFINEWPDAKAKMVFMSASMDEVLTLLRMMPEVREKILPLCAPRVREIVSEDLKKEDQASPEAKEKSLASLKLRLLQVINQENIHLEEIFPDGSSFAGGHRAAS